MGDLSYSPPPAAPALGSAQPTVAVPASGVPVAAVTTNRMYYISANTLGCTVAVGAFTVAVLLATQVVPIFVPAGLTLTVTYTNIPTWTVFGT